MQLSRTISNELLKLAQTHPNQEICGLIGVNSTDTQQHPDQTCYPISNIATDTHTLFEMNPKEQINAMKKMRNAGQSLFAIYHSHPKTPAIPSEKDIQQHQYPDVYYLVISLGTEGVLQMNAYKISKDKQILPIEMEIY